MGFRYLVTSCALAMLHCGTVQAHPLQAGGTEWRPFSYSDEHGHLRGVSTDIARQALGLAKVEARFVSYPVKRLQAMLDKGQIDLNYADSPSWNVPLKKEKYVFSIPYMQVREHLYFMADSPAAGFPVARLKNLTIGTVRGYTYPVLEPGIAAKRLTFLETSEDRVLLELLQTGRVDAVAMVDDLYNYLITSQRLDPERFRRGAQLSDAPLAIKLQLKHAALLPRINAAINTMQRSGELERIRRTYLPQAPGLLSVACTANSKACRSD